MKSIVVAGSRGIGKAIADQLEAVSDEIVCTNSRQLDTSNIENVKGFIKKHPVVDVLVLNTGGPPATDFKDITEEMWHRFFKQLFLSFVLMLQQIRVNDNGYVFLISSYYIKEPNPKLILSNSLRIALVSVLKALSKTDMSRNITFINIAPGPTDTDRLKELAAKKGVPLEEYIDSLPTKRAANPVEIGKFVRFIVENKIKSLNGVTINFDMGLSSYIL